MRKLYFIFFILIIFVNINYASYPVTEMIDNEIENSNDDEDPDWIENLFGINFDNGKIPPLSVFILPWLIPLLLFYLIRGYNRDVDWIRKLIRWKNIWWLPLLILIIFIIWLIDMGL